MEGCRSEGQNLQLKEVQRLKKKKKKKKKKDALLKFSLKLLTISRLQGL